MTALTAGRLLGVALLAGTCLTAPIAAFADSDLEARVSRLEGMLQQILDRLDDREEALTSSEAETLSDAAETVREAQAAPVTQPAQPVESPASPAMATASTVQMPPQSPALRGPARDGFMIGDTNVTFDGFIKLDVSLTDFSGGSLPSSNIGRDFYIPALVPVGGADSDPVFDTNIRESRFIFGTRGTYGGIDVTSRLELDFQVTSGGDERISNSFTPRTRQIYLTVDDWLFGEAWSTFQDVAALPENLDFIGPTEGTVFVRQPMIRYTRGGLELAIEQPETTVTSRAGIRALPGEDFLPDFVGRYRWAGDWGHLKIAGIVRALTVNGDPALGVVDDTAIGFGGSLSGKVRIGGSRDDLRFMVTAGQGLGRYVGLNLINDVAIRDDGSLDAIPLYSGFVSYRHWWNEKWRSNITAGAFFADNPVRLTGGGVTDNQQSGHLNLIYSPVPQVDIGIEAIYARRELENGLDGAMRKLQFSSKYSF